MKISKTDEKFKLYVEEVVDFEFLCRGWCVQVKGDNRSYLVDELGVDDYYLLCLWDTEQEAIKAMDEIIKMVG